MFIRAKIFSAKKNKLYGLSICIQSQNRKVKGPISLRELLYKLRKRGNLQYADLLLTELSVLGLIRKCV